MLPRMYLAILDKSSSDSGPKDQHHRVLAALQCSTGYLRQSRAFGILHDSNRHLAPLSQPLGQRKLLHISQIPARHTDSTFTVNHPRNRHGNSSHISLQSAINPFQHIQISLNSLIGRGLTPFFIKVQFLIHHRIFDGTAPNIDTQIPILHYNTSPLDAITFLNQSKDFFLLRCISPLPSLCLST